MPWRRTTETSWGVPRRTRWVFPLRRNCNVAGTYRETSLRRWYDVLLPGGTYSDLVVNRCISTLRRGAYQGKYSFIMMVYIIFSRKIIVLYLNLRDYNTTCSNKECSNTVNKCGNKVCALNKPGFCESEETRVIFTLANKLKSKRNKKILNTHLQILVNMKRLQNSSKNYQSLRQWELVKVIISKKFPCFSKTIELCLNFFVRFFINLLVLPNYEKRQHIKPNYISTM